MTAQSEIGPFASAATAFARLVRDIPETAWDGPGLGEWDLRSLVGHPSIALSSAGAYLKAPAEREDVASAADYYALVHKFASSAEATTGNEEAGRRAGIELGVDPAAAIDSLVEHALSDLAGAEDQRQGRGWRRHPAIELRVHSHVRAGSA